MTQKITLGTRGSTLAMTQTRHVAGLLQAACPETEIEIRIISTKGDEVRDVPLSKIGDKGLFTRELESALHEGLIDAAVHSLKDLQTHLPEGLVIAAVPERATPYDALVCRQWDSLDALPEGARVGTSSLRRRAQLLAYRRDVTVVDLRGNVETRLRKVADGEVDAAIVASAGLERIGRAEAIAENIPADIMVPAVSQGALAIETCAGHPLREMLAVLTHRDTLAEVTAERALMAALEGGCLTPIGALGRVEGESLELVACVASLDGVVVLRERRMGSITDPEGLGRLTAQALLDDGAAEVIARAGRGGHS